MTEEKQTTEKLSKDESEKVRKIANTMGYGSAIQFLENKDEEERRRMERILNKERQMIDISYSFNAFAHEGAYAVYLAVVEKYGELDLASPKGPSGGRNPEMINVELPSGEFIKIPWGTVNLPIFEDEESYLKMNWDSRQNLFYVNGEIKQKYNDDVEELAKTVREKLNNESIYSGKAISLHIGGRSDEFRYSEPKFLDLSNIKEDDVVISDQTKSDLNPIIQRIAKTEMCKKNGLDLKYGALLEGPYGTGKTLIAFMIAKMAIKNNWTFIYLDDCFDTAKALKIAENFTKGKSKGCIIFAEDIDQAVRGERNHEMQQILNTIDGGDTKGKPIISIFTTNHMELIEPTFLRGKRIGSIISMGALNKKTADKFIRKIAVDEKGKSLMETENVEEASAALTGIVPAFAHEVIDASKIYMIARNSNKISNNDIVLAAESYKKQIEVAQCKDKTPNKNKVENALQALYNFVNGYDEE